MKKCVIFIIPKNLLFMLSTVIALVFVFAACNKSDDMMDNIQTVQKGEMIPIAKLTDNDIIEFLFLQKDVQEFFIKENIDKKLIFVEVIDNEKNGEKAGLLYRIYDVKNKVAETTINYGLTLVDNFYYLSPMKSSLSVTCTTSDCASEQLGCIPDDFACTECANGGKCTKTVGSVMISLARSSVVNATVNATHYAAFVD